MRQDSRALARARARGVRGRRPVSLQISMTEHSSTSFGKSRGANEGGSALMVNVEYPVDSAADGERTRAR